MCTWLRMRIETELTNDDSEAVQKLADERGLQKDRAYTDIIRAGLHVEQRRDAIKELIVRFFEDEEPRYDKRQEALRDQYDIDEINRYGEGEFEIIHDGNSYTFLTPDDLQFVNGDSVDKSICPECESADIDLDFDALDTDESAYTCEECGNAFDKADRLGVPDQSAADHVTEFARRRQELFEYVLGQLTQLLDAVMGTYGGVGRDEWLHPGMYQYQNGFQSVTIPFWTTDISQIQFHVDEYRRDYVSIRNPLYFRATEQLTDDYLSLVQEINAANPDAKRVTPIFVDQRGRKPEIIEVHGLDYEETHLPLYTVGYEVEKAEPSDNDLGPMHDDDTPVTWIRVTGDKPIEQEDGDD